jgi:predicted small secreted protein
MNTRSQAIATKWLTGFFVLVGCLAFTGCNTIEGAGEDVEDAGEAVQDAAE